MQMCGKQDPEMQELFERHTSTIIAKQKDFKKLSNMRLSDVRSNENNREKIYSS